MTREEIQEILDRCDERYVKKEDCDSDMKEVNDKLSNDNTRLAVIEHKIDSNTWWTRGVLIAAIADIVALIISRFIGG